MDQKDSKMETAQMFLEMEKVLEQGIKKLGRPGMRCFLSIALNDREGGVSPRELMEHAYASWIPFPSCLHEMVINGDLVYEVIDPRLPPKQESNYTFGRDVRVALTQKGKEFYAELKEALDRVRETI